MPGDTMTPRQIELARHALGLDGRRTCSYRNRFIAGPRHYDYGDWQAMAAAGHATRHDGKSLSFVGGADLFCLTISGARAALLPGEQLDAEDFPDAR